MIMGDVMLYNNKNIMIPPQMTPIPNDMNARAIDLPFIFDDPSSGSTVTVSGWSVTAPPPLVLIENLVS